MLLNQNLSLSRLFRISWGVMLTLSVLCAAAYFLEIRLFSGHNHIPGVIPSLIGTSLAFFVGFNNNQAYNRWWEARTIWGGLVNDSRSWTRNVLYYTVGSPSPDQRSEELPEELADPAQQLPIRMVRRHLSFLSALKWALRGTKDQSYRSYLNKADQQFVDRFTNVPCALLDLQTQDLHRLRDLKQIDGYAFLTLNELIVRFSDGMGKCERIQKTVFPVTYFYFTRVFIWVLTIMLTMVMVDEAGAWAIPLGWLVGFVFHITQHNGESLMNPFDGNPASVPIHAIVRTIEINTLETLNETKIPPPIQAINSEYIL
jgi:putative membrane protein